MERSNEMNRSEHLQWCKDRAMEYVRSGEISAAFASFTSDMRKHPKTIEHPALPLGHMLLFDGHLKTADEMEKWILGFN